MLRHQPMRALALLISASLPLGAMAPAAAGEPADASAAFGYDAVVAAVTPPPDATGSSAPSATASPAARYQAGPAPADTGETKLQGTGVSGTVRTAAGERVGGATLRFDGAQHVAIRSAGDGSFVAELTPGLYRVRVEKPGYVTAELGDVSVLPGALTPLTVALSAVDLSSLRTIGTVTVSRGSSINTGAAAETIVSRDAVQQLANPEINDILQRVPDLNVQHLGSQPDTSIVLAGAQPYETQVLIDGHPIAFGQYGVWLSQYYSSFLVGGVETQAGPGNTTPFASNAIGGTVNLLTPAYTRKPTQQLVVGTDQFSSQYANFLATGTANKFGYVVGLGYGSSNGPYFQKSKCVVIPDDPANDNTKASNGIIDFCGNSAGSLFTKGEILKAKYDFSPATSFEAGFVGAQGGYQPQGTSYGQSLGSTLIDECLPSQPLSCSNPANAGLVGKRIDAYAWYPGSNVYSNQPIFTGQFRTTFDDTTLLVRPYAGNIDSIVDGSHENNSPLFFAPAGTVPTYAAGQPLPSGAFANGGNAFENYCNNDNFLGEIGSPQNTTTVASGQEECYQTPFSEYEQDKLYGSTFSLLRTIGSTALNFSYDFHGTNTFAYYNAPSDVAVPDTTERYNIFSLVASAPVARNVKATVAAYDTIWKLFGSQPVDANGDLGPLSRSVTKIDPHVNLTFAPHGGISYRVAYGTSETFPFAGQVSGLPFSTPPSATAPEGLFTQKNPFLAPETAVEFSIGADARLRTGGTIGFDLQSTVVHDVFETLTIPGRASVAGADETVIEPVNVARLKGTLAQLHYTYAPVAGLGYNVSLAADRSVLDGIPQSFYANGPALPVNGQQICSNGQSTPGIPTCIPFLKGYGQATYTWKDQTFLELGVDYEGKNNTYYQPPFAQVDATFRKPIKYGLVAQISAENLLGSNNFSNLAAPGLGVPVVAQNGSELTSISSALIPTLPRTLRFQLSETHIGQ